MNNIDFEFACRALGNRYPQVRAPSGAQSRAGVEIGKKINLATMKSSDLRRLPLPDSLKKKLEPYLGKTGAELAASWRWQPLKLSIAERSALLKVEATPRLPPLNARYMSSASNSSRQSIGSLPKAAQTAIFLLDWQTGGRTANRAPGVWEALCQQNWGQARDLVTRTSGLSSKESVGRLLARIA